MASNQAETAEEALRVTLEALCTRLGYPLGHVFRVQGDELDLVRPVARRRPRALRGLPPADRDHRLPPRRRPAGPGAGDAAARCSWATSRTTPRSYAWAPTPTCRSPAAFAFPVLVGTRDGGGDRGVLRGAARARPADARPGRPGGHPAGPRRRARPRPRRTWPTTPCTTRSPGCPTGSLLLDRLGSRAGRAAAAATATWPCCSSTSTGSRSINDAAATPPATQLLMAVGPPAAGRAPPDDTVARLGGDEFVVLCEDVDDERAALRGGRAAPAAARRGRSRSDGQDVPGLGQHRHRPADRRRRHGRRPAARRRRGHVPGQGAGPAAATSCSTRTCATCCSAGSGPSATCAARSSSDELRLHYQPVVAPGRRAP